MTANRDRARGAAGAKGRHKERWKFWLWLGLVVVVAYYVYAVSVLLQPIEADRGTSATTTIQAAQPEQTASQPRIDIGKLGQLGDSVGGVLNPVLTVVLVIAALITYLSQRDELKNSQRLLNEQMEAAQQQDRRRLFLDLVSIQERMLQEIRAEDGSGQSGRDAIAEMLETDELAKPAEVDTKLAHIESRFIKSYPGLSRYLRAAEVVLDFACSQIHDAGASQTALQRARYNAENQALYSMLMATFDQCELLVFAGVLLANKKQDERLCVSVLRSKLLEGIDDEQLLGALKDRFNQSSV